MASMRDIDPEKLPDSVFEKMGISKTDFAALRERMAERDSRTPAIGSEAPDFEIERLSPEGARTGERFRLAECRGRPVALVFGSYT